jgi:hypothetical protein
LYWDYKNTRNIPETIIDWWNVKILGSGVLKNNCQMKRTRGRKKKGHGWNEGARAAIKIDLWVMEPKMKPQTGMRRMIPKRNQMTSNAVKNEVKDETEGQGRRQWYQIPMVSKMEPKRWGQCHDWTQNAINGGNMANDVKEKPRNSAMKIMGWQWWQAKDVINAMKGPKNEAGDKTNDAKGIDDTKDKYNDARGGRWRPKAQEKVKMRPMRTKMPRTKTMMPGRGRWRSTRGQNEANEDKNAKDKKNDARKRPMEAKRCQWRPMEPIGGQWSQWRPMEPIGGQWSQWRPMKPMEANGANGGLKMRTKWDQWGHWKTMTTWMSNSNNDNISLN